MRPTGRRTLPTIGSVQQNPCFDTNLHHISRSLVACQFTRRRIRMDRLHSSQKAQDMLLRSRRHIEAMEVVHEFEYENWRSLCHLESSMAPQATPRSSNPFIRTRRRPPWLYTALLWSLSLFSAPPSPFYSILFLLWSPFDTTHAFTPTALCNTWVRPNVKATTSTTLPARPLPRPTALISTNYLLSKQEEVSLTQAIRLLRQVIRIRDQLAVAVTQSHSAPIHPNAHVSPATLVPYTPSEEEWATACNVTVPHLRRILIQGREARSKLVSANIGLVMQIAKRYSYQLHLALGGGESGGSSSSISSSSVYTSPSTSSSSASLTTGMGTILTLQDMIQEGNLGLMEAAERFDSRRGFRFSTYAAYWVRQRILRCIDDHSRIIRLPSHVHSMLRNIRKAKARMEKEIGRTPSLPELAHYMTIPLDKLRLYTDSSRTVLSLEVPLNRSTQTRSSTLEEDKRTLGEKIACTEEPSVEDDATYDALRTDIRLAIDSLGNDKERDVLIARFGLEDGTPKTLEETAKRLGLSRDRVRMVEARALNKLRHPQRNYKLKVYVNGGGISSSQGGHSVEWREGHPSWEMGSSATSTNTTHGSSSKAMTSTIDHWERSSSRSSSSIFNQATNKRKVHGIKSLWTDERDTLSKFSPETIWSV